MAQALALEAMIQEAIVKPIVNFAERLRCALSQPAGEDPLATLQQDYRAEQRLAKRFRAHALLMPNDLFRDALNEIAADTEHHAHLLAEQIQALGGCLPRENGQETTESQPISTIWRLIAADIAAVGAVSQRYPAQLGWISSPPIQRTLQHIRAAKHRHRQKLSDLLARIDSYAKPESDHRNHP